MSKNKNNFANIPDKTQISNSTTKIEPYKVFGRDFSLTDPDYITYYKIRMKIMAVRYQLVGHVNSKGQYVISDQVKVELINMLKEIEDMDNDWYRVSAIYMKKYYYFHVKLYMLEDGKAKASLYLSEFVDDFLEDEYIVSHIADFVDVFDDDFRIKVRKAFNLVDVAVPMQDIQVPNIAVIMQDAFDLEMVIGGLYDIASQIYLMRMLKILEEAGEQGKAILRRYKELITDKDENDVNEKHRYTKFKSLLDRAIDEFGGFEKLKVDKNLIRDVVIELNSSIKAITNMQNRPGAIEILRTDRGQEKVAGNTKSVPNIIKKINATEEKVKGVKKTTVSKNTTKAEKKTGGGWLDTLDISISLSSENTSTSNTSTSSAPISTQKDDLSEVVEEEKEENVEENQDEKENIESDEKPSEENDDADFSLEVMESQATKENSTYLGDNLGYESKENYLGVTSEKEGENEDFLTDKEEPVEMDESEIESFSESNKNFDDYANSL